jgi:hypothetical protein
MSRPAIVRKGAKVAPLSAARGGLGTPMELFLAGHRPKPVFGEGTPIGDLRATGSFSLRGCIAAAESNSSGGPIQENRCRAVKMTSPTGLLSRPRFSVGS